MGRAEEFIKQYASTRRLVNPHQPETPSTPNPSPSDPPAKIRNIFNYQVIYFKLIV